MSNRRDFLKKSMIGAAAVAIPASFATEAKAATFLPSGFKIGFQLWGVRDLLASENHEEAYRLLSLRGVEGIEYANMLNAPYQPPIKRRLMQNKYNLVPCGNHHSLSEWMNRGAEAIMEHNYILGNTDVSCHWLDPPQRGSLENYLSHSRFFRELTPMLKKNGFNFYYHNHAFEYTDIFDGKFAMDIMLENTDPNLFKMQLHIAGLPASVNTVDYIRKLGGRLMSLHFPVFDRDGNLSIRQEIIDAAKESGSCKWFIIEQGIPDLATGGESLARMVSTVRDMLNK